MIYLDTSVALAQLLAEDRRPPAALWEDTLVSGRLLEWWYCLPSSRAHQAASTSSARAAPPRGRAVRPIVWR